MKRLLAMLLMAVFLAGLGLGCGGDKDKGINKNDDRPRSTDKG